MNQVKPLLGYKSMVFSCLIHIAPVTNLSAYPLLFAIFHNNRHKAWITQISIISIQLRNFLLYAKVSHNVAKFLLASELEICSYISVLDCSIIYEVKAVWCSAFEGKLIVFVFFV